MSIEYELKSDLTIRKIKNELFVFDRNSATVHTFNEIGAQIFQLIENSIPQSEIAPIILEHYDISIETCQNDILEFLQQLQDKKLIRVKEQQ
jgi:hypothetical protein